MIAKSNLCWINDSHRSSGGKFQVNASECSYPPHLFLFLIGYKPNSRKSSHPDYLPVFGNDEYSVAHIFPYMNDLFNLTDSVKNQGVLV